VRVGADRWRLAAIFNPTSGGGRFRRDLPLIVESFRALGWDAVERATEGEGHATVLAREALEEGVDRVVVIGGDGTVNEVLNGLAGSDVPLAIVPTGTVNVLALELGLPLDPPDAVRVASGWRVTRIDLGLAGERYFALMAGVGLDADVVSRVRPVMKRAFKEMAFVLQGLTTYLTAEYPLVRIECDDRYTEGYFVVLGNARNYGGTFGITPLADMRDGLLDVVVLKDMGFFSVAHYWLAAVLSAHLQHPKVEYFRTASARLSVVQGDTPVLVQTDGEIAGLLPLECRVVPGALKVVTP
jgi:YegS/Rv2252/BmrU family lipid kinase